jgi:hypothetical protein
MASLRNLAIGALRLAGHPSRAQRYDIPAATQSGRSRSSAWHTHEGESPSCGEVFEDDLVAQGLALSDGSLASTVGIAAD